jgi:hypothetical protein
MEPVVGFEPTTDGLQNRCSTTELNWHKEFADSAAPTTHFFNSGLDITISGGEMQVTPKIAQ